MIHAVSKDPLQSPLRLILVTGPSGAGRSTAIRALEDMSFEAIDNLPLSFLPRLLDMPDQTRPLAVGIDVRTRDFSVEMMLETLDLLRQRFDVDLELLFIDCRAEVLLRRFSETRRRHPLAPVETPAQGIDRELDLMEPIRTRADHLIDTSEMTLHDLRAELSRTFARQDTTGLAVSVVSFSYKRGVPRGVDMIFDCRFLRNPYWDTDLREQDGRDSDVVLYIQKDQRFSAFLAQVTDLCALLLPAYKEEGKSHLSIGFGCTGGQHRSVMMTEHLAQGLAGLGWQVSKRHRELDRVGL